MNTACFPTFGSEPGNFWHGNNRGVRFNALHPFLEGGLMPLGVLLCRLGHVLLAILGIHRAVSGRESGLCSKLL
jgi:hypothetical protein